MLATVVGVIAIWTEITPALRMFERVEIWPEIAWRAPERDSLEIFAEQLEPVESGEATTPAEASGQSSVTGPLALAQRAESPSDGTFPITLWVLGKALIIGLLTIVRVRDLPGVLDLSLLRRTRLDPGARIAVLTLSRYIFTFMGSAYVFRTLGISWASVQWLASAMTFGLGFGLQEIVGNFVSGIILLAERPVRVGDAVTIGNLSGRVTRIRIRATTVELAARGGSGAGRVARDAGPHA